MSYGYLRVQSFAARLVAPIGGVRVTVTNGTDTYTLTTNAEGNADDLRLEAPDASYSLDENNTTVLPYSVWDLTATKEGYQDVIQEGIQVFSGQVSLARLQLLPSDTDSTVTPADPAVDTPEHALFAGGASSGDTPAENCTGGGAVLDQPIIPTRITVHLGRPAASAKNVTVSFREYIANVASSEVYPTWPEQALRANIHAQISLALNRIYTEWYPSKGYSFNITNSTSYDQYFVYNRTIFAIMERITDELFNTYVRRTGSLEPYYTEYCDGKSVTCPGMKQWGTVDRANAGLNALQILRYYYGNNIEIVETNNIQAIPTSYPGTPLRLGSSGAAVATIQRQLNRIAKDYPSFGTLTVDGNFGATTDASVKKFQRQFGLTADGVVGKSTWYKISYIYVSVKDLAELTSEGETESGAISGGTWGGTTLRVGSTGTAVQQVQFWLNTLALYNDSLLTVTVDGQYGSATAAAVRAFQTAYGLTADGVVGQTTWNRLFSEYQSAQNDATQNGAANYPGSPVRRGDTGSAVKLVQFYLRIAAANYSNLYNVEVDGVFGVATENAVRRFQTYFSLTSDGVVGRTTWNKLYEIYAGIANRLLSPNQRPGVFPGVLRSGSSGTSVRELQYYLYFLSAYYPSIPQVSIDGVFGASTTAAVRAYQTQFGLVSDGIVGQRTWSSLYAQFNSLSGSGPVVSAASELYPGVELAVGAVSEDVRHIRYLLEFVAFYYPAVQSNGIEDTFDTSTEVAVRSFQTEFGLPVTGVVDESTWEALQGVYLGLLAQQPGGVFTPEEDPAGYPGYGLGIDSTGSAVLQLQQWLNETAVLYCSIPFVPENGIFGTDTDTAVKRFQEAFGLPITGVVDQATWDALRTRAAENT